MSKFDCWETGDPEFGRRETIEDLTPERAAERFAKKLAETAEEPDEDHWYITVRGREGTTSYLVKRKVVTLFVPHRVRSR